MRCWRLFSLLLLGMPLLARSQSQETLPADAHEALPATLPPAPIEDEVVIEEAEEEEEVAFVPTTPSHEFLQRRAAGSDAPDCGPHQQPTSDPPRLLVLLAKLDGELVALDAAKGGREAWRLNTDGDSPLLSSTLGDVELVDGAEVFKLIPSLDGNLYMYQSPGVMQAVPVSSDSLMSASLRFGADVVAGGKTVATHGLNARTGQLHYSCTLSDCDRAKLPPSEVRHNLVVKRTSQTVRALDPATGYEKWNVSVGELQLLMSQPTWGAGSDASFCQANGQTDESAFWQRMRELRFIINPPSGYVAAVSASDPSVVFWEANVGAPIAQAWELRERAVGELSFFDPVVVPHIADVTNAKHRDLMIRPDSASSSVESSIYMGTYRSEHYVIPSPQERRKLRHLALASAASAAQLEGREEPKLIGGAGAGGRELVPLDPERVYAPRDPDMPPPYHLPAGSEDDQCSLESCPTCSSAQAHAIIQRRDHSVDGGWYLFKRKTGGLSPRTRRWLLSDTRRRQTIKEVLDSSVGAFLATWWRSLLLSAASVLLTVAGMRYRYRTERQMLEVERKASLSRSGDAETDATPPVQKDSGSFPTHGSKDSGDSFASLGHASRFLQDYEPQGVLGRGGFGIVYSARNKVDQHSYAVKRVRVPNAERGRRAVERVSREVGVLASLHHPAIVRYYAAWFESYPAHECLAVQRRISEACGEAEAEEAEEESAWTEERSFARLQSTGPDLSSLCKDLNHNIQVGQAEGPSLLGGWGGNDSGLTSEELDASESWADFSIVKDSQGEPMSRSADSSVHSLGPSPSAAPRTSAGPTGAGDSRSLEVVFGAASASAARTQGEGKPAEDRLAPLASSEDSHSGARPPVAPDRLYLFITMQLCQESTLALWLRDHCEARDRQGVAMLDWFAQILSAVEYVHDAGLIHRDLKPSNVFFDDAQHLKVGDFGLATAIAEEVEGLGEEEDGAGGHHTADVGTRLYMSPEQRKGSSYTSAVDVWALGLVLVEMLVPFGTEMERRTALMEARQGRLPPSFRGPEESLVRRMLSLEPEERPSCRELRESASLQPFFQNPDWIRSLSSAPALRARTKTSSRTESKE